MAAAPGWTPPKFCAKCGAPRSADERFCGNCGADFARLDAGELDEARTAPAAPAQAPTPHTSVIVVPQSAPQTVPVAVPYPAQTGGYAPQPGAAAQPRKGLFSVSVAGIEFKVRLLPLLGAVAVLVSSFLAWLEGSGGKADGYDIPFDFVLDYKTSGGEFKLGVAALLLAIGGAVLSVLPEAFNPIRRAAGLGAIALAVAFAIQVGIFVDDNGGTVEDFFQLIEPGVYVCLVGGILLASQR